MEELTTASTATSQPMTPPAFRRTEILSHFFNLNPQHKASDPSYFAYFEKQIRLASQNNDFEDEICTPKICVFILQRLKDGVTRGCIKEDAAAFLRRDNAEETQGSLESAIDLVARLYLMVHIGTIPRGITGQKGITWQQGSLSDAIKTHFQHQVILTDSVKLERKFNLQFIDQIAAVSIQWTPNLIDHLKFIEDGKKPVLNVFHCAGFLEWQKENAIYPPNLIQETLLTLALLLPTHSTPCRKWYLAQAKTHNLSPLAIEIGQLKLEERQIAHFRYWHDRLVILKQYFDESKPKTIKQWWYDDRERVQWFWVAIVLVGATLVFGFIQCFEGGWQIWKAYHPEPGS